MENITSIGKYLEMQSQAVTLPSGAVFLIKKRMAYGDYIDLVNKLSKAAGKPADANIFDEVGKNPELLNQMLEIMIPKLSINPKISIEEEEGSLSIKDITFEDLLYLMQQGLKVKDREEIETVKESFLTPKLSSQ